LKSPFAFVYNVNLAWHTVGAGPKKLFLYVVSRIKNISTILSTIVWIMF